MKTGLFLGKIHVCVPFSREAAWIQTRGVCFSPRRGSSGTSEGFSLSILCTRRRCRWRRRARSPAGCWGGTCSRFEAKELDLFQNRLCFTGLTERRSWGATGTWISWPSCTASGRRVRYGLIRPLQPHVPAVEVTWKKLEIGKIIIKIRNAWAL